LERGEVAGVGAVFSGEEGPPIVLVSGPPAGAVLFREVQERLRPQRSVAVELLEFSGPEDTPAPERLSQVVTALSPGMVVGHGLAVPTVCALDAPPLVVLSNGPTTSLDSLTALVRALPGPALSSALFHPLVLRRWLASSLGLRRAVKNPYVMEREVVDELTASMLRSKSTRRAAARWLKDLELPVRFPAHVHAVWGDDDVLHPVDEIHALLGPERVHRIAGGRWFHPQERPWALADACLEILRRSGN
jgi:pimeloyl-ACP methyl ester carboxylesterase